MTLFVILEPLYQGTYWCSQYMKGIKHEANQTGFDLRQIDINESGLIKETAAQEGIRPIALVAGTSITWIPQVVQELQKGGIHTVMISPFFAGPLFNTSSVTMDYAQTIFTLCEYFDYYEKTHTALLGSNPNSTGDRKKQEAFSKFRERGGIHKKCEVLPNMGSLEDCCNEFFSRLDEFDSVICCSDVVAIWLSNFLKKKGVDIPNDIWLAAFGDTALSGLVRPGITTAILDCSAIGRNAVRMAALLTKNPVLTSLSATVAGAVHVRESTAFRPADTKYVALPLEKQTVKEVNFYSDEAVRKIFYLEKLVSHCDNIDFSILKGVYRGDRYCDLSEDLHFAENTIKYRVKRMIDLAHTNNRDELIKLASEYLDFTVF